MILAIDSASLSASAALVTPEGLLVAQSFQNTGLTHSATLLPMVESMARNSGTALEDITAIAVTNGPGSFTGLRIGTATALGLAAALELPCRGVSSLRAAAYGALPFAGTIAVVFDARRNQFYTASFQSDGKALTRLEPDMVLSRAELLVLSKTKPLCWAGDAAFSFQQETGGVTPPNPHTTAYGAALCLRDGETRPPEALAYLRKPQAEREREQAARGGQPA